VSITNVRLLKIKYGFKKVTGNSLLILKCTTRNAQFVVLNARMSIILDYTWASAIQEVKLRVKMRRKCNINILIYKTF
jgi:hypothetical protein